MTDRIKGLTIALDRDYRDDDVFVPCTSGRGVKPTLSDTDD